MKSALNIKTKRNNYCPWTKTIASQQEDEHKQQT